MKQPRLPFTVGVEYTFLCEPVFKGSISEYKGGIEYYGDNRVKRPQDHYSITLREKGFKSAYSDGYRVVEIPSPIHRTMKSVETFYNKLTRHTKALKLKTHEDTKKGNTIITEMNGGGHVHIGLPKFMSEERKKLWWRFFTLKVANAPWLSWIFGQYCDDINAKSALSNCWLREYLKLDVYWELYDKMEDDKELCIIPRSRTKTIEWRIFDAPKDFTDVKNYIDFAVAFTQATLDEYLVNEWRTKLDYRSDRAIKKISELYCWIQFRLLLEKLGLDPRRYNKYRKNLEDRFAYGRLV